MYNPMGVPQRQYPTYPAPWLRPGAPTGGMGGMPGMGPMGGMAAPTFQPGRVVVPRIAHMPEHRDRAARVVQVVTNQPFYVLDFGDGRLHRWYAQTELQAAPPGVQASQTVPGVTGEEMGH